MVAVSEQTNDNTSGTTIDNGQVDTSAALPVIHPLKNASMLEPPSIPHITSNYASVATIVSNVVFHCYAELQNILETLPSVNSDIARKRRFLNYLVSARQQLVKVYVLLKWAFVSNGISRCIDVVSWLTGQQNCFANVVNVLVDIDRNLAGAKLRNPDIETALEVFKYGRPIQKWLGFKPLKPLSPQIVLHTMRDLDVLLSIRLALAEDLAPRYRQYRISDGRVRFTIENSFIVDLGIADDSTEARFFLVDFQFVFDGSSSTCIPLDVKLKLEKFINDMLNNKSLGTVFDWLLRFTQNYKLSYFHQQLISMANGFWSGFINHVFYSDKSLIVIQYWVSRLGSKNIIELGLLKTNLIGIRWLREGIVVSDHNIEFGQDNLDVETLVLSIIELHSQYSIKGIQHALSDLLGDRKFSNSYNHGHIKSFTGVGHSSSSVDMTKEKDENAVAVLISQNRLRIQLTGTRYTILSIDPLSGRSVLSNSTQLLLAAERSLNDLQDLTGQGADILFKLRFISIQEEIITRAKAAGWVANSTVLISNDDMKKYFTDKAKLLFSLRLPSWPLSWFVLVSISINSPPKWWLSRLESKDKMWTITFLEPVYINQENPYVYAYNLFDNLAMFATSRFKIQLLTAALEAKSVIFSLFKIGDKKCGLPAVMVNLKTLMKFSWAHSSLLITLEDNSNSVLVQGRAKKSLSSLTSITSTSSGVILDPLNGKFSLKLSLDETSNWSQHFVDLLSRKLSQVERVVSYIELIKSMSLDLVDSSMEKITFLYSDNLYASISWKDDGVITLELSKDSPHSFVVKSLESILNESGLLPMVYILQTTLPLYVALQDLSRQTDSATLSGSSTPLVIYRNVNDIKLQYPQKELSIEINVIKYKRQRYVVSFTETSNSEAPLLKDVWVQPEQGIIPLLKGLACEFDKVNRVLTKIQQGLDSNYIVIE